MDQTRVMGIIKGGLFDMVMKEDTTPPTYFVEEVLSPAGRLIDFSNDRLLHKAYTKWLPCFPKCAQSFTFSSIDLNYSRVVNIRWTQFAVDPLVS